MGKSKRRIAELTRSFQDAVAERFPDVQQEVFLEEVDGFDAWIRIEVPPKLSVMLSEILDLSVATTEKIWTEDGIGISGVVVQKREPVHGQRQTNDRR